MWTLLSTIQFSRGERFIMHFTIVLEKVAKPQNFLLVEFFRTYNTGSTAVLNLAHTTSCFYCVASLTKLWLPNLSVVHWPYPPKKIASWKKTKFQVQFQMIYVIKNVWSPPGAKPIVDVWTCLPGPLKLSILPDTQLEYCQVEYLKKYSTLIK